LIKNLLIFYTIVALTQSTLDSSCEKETENKLVSKKDYSVETTIDFKKEFYKNENDEIIIHYTYFSPQAHHKSSIERCLKDGTSIETLTKQDDTVNVYYTDLHGNSRRIS
jgi:hypothetical protein